MTLTDDTVIGDGPIGGSFVSEREIKSSDLFESVRAYIKALEEVNRITWNNLRHVHITESSEKARCCPRDIRGSIHLTLSEAYTHEIINVEPALATVEKAKENL